MRLLRYAPSDSSTYIKYASGVLGRKPCISRHLRHSESNAGEKVRLENPGVADLEEESAVGADQIDVLQAELIVGVAEEEHRAGIDLV